MPDKNSLIIGYLQRNLIVFFGTEINGVFSLDLKEDVVKDLEVIDAEKLENQIKVFVSNFKLPPCNLILVLSDALVFQKDIIGVSSQDIDSYVQNFLDNVPIENIFSKLFPIENGVKVIAVNKQLFESVGRAFQNLGFVVLSVIPEILLGKNIVDAQTGIDTDISPFFSNLDFIKTNTMWSHAVQLHTSSVQAKKEQVPNNNKRMYVLLGVFVTLLVVLILMIVVKR